MAAARVGRALSPPLLAGFAAVTLLALGTQPANAATPAKPSVSQVGKNSAVNVAGMGNVTGVVADSATGAPLAGARVEITGTATMTGADGRYNLNVPAGSQPVDVTAFGYAPQEVNVTVVEDGTIIQGFNLVSVPSVTVHGKIIDGSGHGWPLYAKVSVAGGGAAYTNPVTGDYSVSIPKGTKQIVSFSSVYPGYEDQSVILRSDDPDLVNNVTLGVGAACTAAGYAVHIGTPTLNEPFDTAATPAGWTIVNHTDQGGWGFTDVGNRGNLTGGTGGFAMIDSDKFGSGKSQDSELLTPALNLSGSATPVLRFNNDYRGYTNGTVDADVTTDGGTTWTNLYHHEKNDSQRGPRQEELSLASVGGQAAVQVRFHYTGAYAYWWELDNVSVANRTCDATPGGLVVGNVTDVNTGLAVNGATVTSTDQPADKAVSAATPDDPALGDGFFWLYSGLTGAHPFAIGKGAYTAASQSATVVANSTVRLDTALKAPRLAFDTNGIEMFQSVGQNRNTYVSVKNTGSSPTNVTLSERSGTTRPTMGKKGAGVRTVTVAGGISKALDANSVRANKERAGIMTSPTSAAPATDGTWSDAANYPNDVSDNSAVAYQGKIYSLGDGAAATTGVKLYIYDAEANTWTAGADAPHSRAKPQLAEVGGKLYAFGGFNSTDIDDTVDVYDIAANTWSTASATNPVPRAAAGTAVIGTKIYLIGGCNSGQCADTNDVSVYDTATGTFGTAAVYPHGVAWISCGAIGAKAYCAGGAAAGSYTDGFVYDAAGNSWSPIADLPIDLWGSGDAVANGTLVLMGGITADSTALTNRSFSYDPAGNTWTELPGARVPTARGAGACGTLKIGGWTAPFTGSKIVEKLSGFDQCGGAGVADVPWLTETPNTFSLDPGKTVKVLVSLNTSPDKGISQPGDYTAQIVADAATPYDAPKVDVLTHVSPPSNWGKLLGTVTGVTCAGNTVPVPATVQLNGTGSNQFTLKATADGKYQYWVPRGKYQLIVAKDDWVPQVKDQSVTAGLVTTVDFVLKPTKTCSNPRNYLAS